MLVWILRGDATLCGRQNRNPQPAPSQTILSSAFPVRVKLCKARCCWAGSLGVFWPAGGVWSPTGSGLESPDSSSGRHTLTSQLTSELGKLSVGLGSCQGPQT